MAFIPEVNQIYKHFKGNLYQIVAIAEHSETGEQMVVYQALYGERKIYVRPLAMFQDKVDRTKYPKVQQELRFELQENGDTMQECTQEEITLDPLVLEFLDADSYEQRLNILAALQHRITDEMITTMAIVCDVEVGEGSTEERYDSLKSCLLTLERYECNRLR